MQHFKDSATGQIYAYDDDVVVINEAQGVALTTAGGVPISAPATLQPYTPPVIDPVSIAKSNQLATISATCAAALRAGFTSSALGAGHTYGSNDDDQRNMLSAALAAQGQGSAWSALLWCATGFPPAWSLTSHTAAQVQQVNADWLAFRQSAQQKYANLVTQINAATTVAAVQAIIWS